MDWKNSHRYNRPFYRKRLNPLTYKLISYCDTTYQIKQLFFSSILKLIKLLFKFWGNRWDWSGNPNFPIATSYWQLFYSTFTRCCRYIFYKLQVEWRPNILHRLEIRESVESVSFVSGLGLNCKSKYIRFYFMCCVTLCSERRVELKANYIE